MDFLMNLFAATSCHSSYQDPVRTVICLISLKTASFLRVLHQGGGGGHMSKGVKQT